MNDELKQLIERVRSGRIHCRHGMCGCCPYACYDCHCHELFLVDCIKLLLSDLERDHPVFDMIQNYVDGY